jgi:hypothetical protein
VNSIELSCKKEEEKHQPIIYEVEGFEAIDFKKEAKTKLQI